MSRSSIFYHGPQSSPPKNPAIPEPNPRRKEDRLGFKAKIDYDLLCEKYRITVESALERKSSEVSLDPETNILTVIFKTRASCMKFYDMHPSEKKESSNHSSTDDLSSSETPPTPK